MNVVCFGDSNTYGCDPRSILGGRYRDCWTDIVAAKTGWKVRNMGVNGREIPRTAPGIPSGTDLLIVMLGSNDLLQGSGPEEAAGKLERFLSGLSQPRDRVLLIAPPPMSRGAWVPDQQLIENSREYARRCRSLAGRLGIGFADAGDWNIPMAYDGVHFTEEGHRAFADGLLKTLKKYVPYP